LDRIQCIRLSGSGEMHSVSVKTGQAKGRTNIEIDNSVLVERTILVVTY